MQKGLWFKCCSVRNDNSTVFWMRSKYGLDGAVFVSVWKFPCQTDWSLGLLVRMDQSKSHERSTWKAKSSLKLQNWTLLGTWTSDSGKSSNRCWDISVWTQSCWPATWGGHQSLQYCNYSYLHQLSSFIHRLQQDMLHWYMHVRPTSWFKKL